MLNGLVRSVRALAVLPVVLLTGCGVAGTQFHPGVAAQVGDETITTRHVDEVTSNYCKAIERVNQDSAQGGGQQTPLRYLSHEFANSLVIRAVAERLADEYDVQPTGDYQANLAQLEPQLEPLTEDEADAVREVIGANDYADNVLTQIGEQLLEDEGTTDSTPEDQLAAGRDRLAEWADDNDVEVNPRYAIEFGTPEQVDTDLSYAVGEAATGGLVAQADPAYTSSLPDHLVCLD